MDINYTPGGHDKIYNAADGGLGGFDDQRGGRSGHKSDHFGLCRCFAQPDETGNNKGNSYYVVMLVTSEWVFYTIPWKQFTQQPYPESGSQFDSDPDWDVPGTGSS